MLESPVLIIATNGHKRNANDAAAAAGAVVKVAAAAVAAAASVAVAAAATVSNGSLNTGGASIETSADHCHCGIVVNSHDHRRKKHKHSMMEADKENSAGNGCETAKPEVKANGDQSTNGQAGEQSNVDYDHVKFRSQSDKPAKKTFSGRKKAFNGQQQPKDGKPREANGNLPETGNGEQQQPTQPPATGEGQTTAKQNGDRKKFSNKNFKNSHNHHHHNNNNNKDKEKDNKTGESSNGNAENGTGEQKEARKDHRKFHNRGHQGRHYNNNGFRMYKSPATTIKGDETVQTPKKRIYYSELSNDEVIAIMKEVSAPATPTTAPTTSGVGPKSPDRRSNSETDEAQLTKEDLDVVSGGLAISLPLLPEPADELIVGCCLASHPGHFYVRFVNDAFDQLNESMNAFYREADDNHIELTFDCIKSGQYYAACRSDKDWIRVQILQVQSNDILHCNLIDHAGVEVFKVSQLQPLYNQFRALPKQAIKCELYRVKPKVGDDWPVEDALKFNELFTGKRFIIDKQTKIDQNQYEERQLISVHDLIHCPDDGDRCSIVDLLIRDGLASLQ